MQFRMPWLSSRRRLLVSLALDSMLFGMIYLVFSKLIFGIWPSFSLQLTALLGFWLVSSYVIGRYYDTSEIYAAAAIKQAIRTLIIFILTIGEMIIWLWLADSSLRAVTSLGFMISFLLVYALGSGYLQHWFSKYLEVCFSHNELWLVLGSDTFYRQLQQELRWGRRQVVLQRVDPNDTVSIGLTDGYYTGLVVDCIEKLDSNLLEILLHIQSKGYPVFTVVAWCEYILHRFPPSLVSRQDLLRWQFTLPEGTIQGRLKRLGDVFVSGFLLTITSPLLVACAFLIKLDDGGPVFYSQLRTGRDGKPFKVWKLRSMYVDSEIAGAQWSAHGDPRITRIGKVLRVARIDELPQLLAVLAGLMSLIGPRPERPEIEADIMGQIPHYRIRHLIKPGLSGWAQVNYPYGASLEDSVNKLSYDLYYVRNSSFWLDILILFKTIRLVFNAKGAVPQSSSHLSQGRKHSCS